MSSPVKKSLRAWNYDKRINTFFANPSCNEEINDLLEYAKQHSLKIAVKGGGYSLGDAYLASDNITLDLKNCNKVISADWENGTVHVEAGIILLDLLQLSVSKGWYIPSLPGWPFSTVGGAVSCSSHGKDSWCSGNFGCNVISLDLLLASGELKTLVKGKDDNLLNAVIGGFGMLGIVTSVRLQLRRLKTSYLISSVQKVTDLEQLPPALERATQTNTFIYTWIDSLSKGKKQCLVEQAAFSREEDERDKVNVGQQNNILSRQSELFWKAIRPFWGYSTMRWANKLKYYLAKEDKAKKQHYIKFQYPWLEFPGAHLLMIYGKGSLDFQNLFPKEVFVEAVNNILEIFSRHKQFLRVCTAKVHKADAPLYSFSGDGYSLSIDINFNKLTEYQCVQLVSDLIETVLKFGGKTYIQKFPLLPYWAFEEMYDHQEHFLNLKSTLDPQNILWSDMAERLFNKVELSESVKAIYGNKGVRWK